MTRDEFERLKQAGALLSHLQEKYFSEDPGESIDKTISCELCRAAIEELSYDVQSTFATGIHGKEGLARFSVMLTHGAWIIGNDHGSGHANDRSPSK